VSKLRLPKIAPPLPDPPLTDDWLEDMKPKILAAFSRLMAEHPTLRDRFAEAVIQGMLASGIELTDDHNARTAYRLADAMLAARKKGGAK